MSDEHDVLTAILVELRGIRSELRDHRRLPTSEAAAADIDRFILAIRGLLQDRVFAVCDLVECSALPENSELRLAISDAFGPTANSRQIGKALRKVEGKNIEGLTVRRVGQDRSGVTWHVASLRV